MIPEVWRCHLGDGYGDAGLTDLAEGKSVIYIGSLEQIDLCEGT